MLPQPLALFPLHQVLFPGGRLALRIFEPRYLDMIGRCIESGEPFGVVGLTTGSEVRERIPGSEDFRQEVFHSTGTLAHLSHWERPQAGLIFVRARGGQRFHLHTSECLKHGLWTGLAEPMDDDAAILVPEDLRPLSTLLQGFLQTLQEGCKAEDMPVQLPYAWEDCGWLANRWSELLPLAERERQHLMALDNPLLRLELVADQLERLGIK